MEDLVYYMIGVVIGLIVFAFGVVAIDKIKSWHRQKLIKEEYELWESKLKHPNEKFKSKIYYQMDLSRGYNLIDFLDSRNNKKN